jgi:hypothetical protein
MSRLTALAVATLAATVLATTLAEAQTRRYPPGRTVYQGRTVYVTPRSFLDPGNVVPVGSLNNYVYIGQYDNPAPYYNQLRARETAIPHPDPRYGLGYYQPYYGQSGF